MNSSDETFLSFSPGFTLFVLFEFALGIFLVVAVSRWLWRLSDRPRITQGTSPSQPAVDPLWWLTTIVLTSAAASLAGGVGALLGVLGFAGVALAVGVTLIVLGATSFRRLALPLALVVTFLAIGATESVSEPGRISPNRGLLTAAPRDSAAAEHQELRRGFGSVLIDLRKTTLRKDRPTRITARSDAGRVVVALPTSRCVNLQVVARPQNPVLDTTAGTVARLATDFGVLPRGEASERGGFAAFDPPDSSINGVQTSGPPGLTLFGQSLYQRSDRDDLRWTRKTTMPAAPTVQLDLRGRHAIVVRDYPDGTSVLGNVDAHPTAGYPELAGAEWPASERKQLPAPPPAPSTKDWARWKRGGVPAAVRLARAAAGPCATQAALANYWVTVETPGFGSDRPFNDREIVDLSLVHEQTGVRVSGTGAVNDLHAVRPPHPYPTGDLQ